MNANPSYIKDPSVPRDFIVMSSAMPHLLSTDKIDWAKKLIDFGGEIFPPCDNFNSGIANATMFNAIVKNEQVVEEIKKYYQETRKDPR